MRTIELADRFAVVRSEGYDEEVVHLMRQLDLARYWNDPAKAYKVPEWALTNYKLERLIRAGFEVV